MNNTKLHEIDRENYAKRLAKIMQVNWEELHPLEKKIVLILVDGRGSLAEIELTRALQWLCNKIRTKR